MKKADLKKLIKPLVKECITEVLIEEGLLTEVVSQVAQGMQASVIVETKQTTKQDKHLFNDELQMKHKTQETRSKLKEHRKKLLDAIGKDSYNGVDLFEGTEPIKKTTQTVGGAEIPSILGDDPTDAGVPLAGILGEASQVWKKLV